MLTFDAKETLKTYTNSIKTAFSKSNCESIGAALDKSNGDIETKRMWVDQCFREFFIAEFVGESASSLDVKRCEKLVELSILAAKSEFCSKMLPIQLMSDIFDIITLDQCDSLFSCVERNIGVWKSDAFFTWVKNQLLRICNDLLRRLSRSQNTVFCGRILLFLAKFFPFSERSGLNIVSEFNLENTTVFSQDSAKGDGVADEEKMDVDGGVTIEKDSKNLSVDYALYSKFWQLQDFFRNPVQCYTNIKWRTFSTYASEVLNTFQSFKVDSISGKRKKSVGDNEDQFFAKYLTNQNLIQLQLSDSNFRRYILIQFLILFQYLRSSVKFKHETQVLSDEQSRWVEKTEGRIYELIGETPPNGTAFAVSVKHILQRETQWNAWKNSGCHALPSVSEKTSKSNGSTKPGGTRKRKVKLGDHVRETAGKKQFLMGNNALTKLWNYCPDNMDACSAPERDFLPQMDDYFSEAMDQLDPANQIEKEYKKVHDGQWGWRALRLLAKKSPHFFTYGNNPIATLPEYLETMLKKMSNSPGSAPSSQNGSLREDAKSAPAKVCTVEQLTKLADNLGDTWKKLVVKLGLTTTDLEAVEKEATEDKDRALLMLKRWLKVEGDCATEDELTYVLEGLKMGSVLDGVFSTPKAE